MFEPTLGGILGNGWSPNVLRGEVAVAGVVAVAPNGLFTSRGERRKGGAIDPDRVAFMDQRYKEALESDDPAFLACIASNSFAPGSPPSGDPAREFIPVETELGGSYSAEWAVSPPPYEAYDSGAIKCEDSLSSPISSSANET
ncbi:hypothetical protein N7541_011390 [Penicillium brevicompactum]|uniref:Uncharacterized protein n=1 Tax=Penicillium brevicompactum TaxID=5074 RepID=A0A9W9QQE5_PENBR|nr:hypothetical protein N7541_011390 [Penicillium brevicompactum]